MTDMTAVIVPRSDQINSDDLIAGPMTITITDVKVQGGQEQPVSIFFAGSAKAFRPCKSMSRVLVAAWGADSKAYIGKSLTLYRDPKVKWGGLEVGGIRISHMSDIERDMTMMLTVTKSNRAPHKVQVLRAAPKPAAPEEPDEGPIHIAARAMAAKGTETFRKWYRDNPSYRAAAQTIIGELQDICAKADAAASEADPFGLPPLADPSPTADDLARAEAEARADIERQSREAAE
jgi:hypothetical protein